MSASLRPPSSFQIDAAKITAYLLNPIHVQGGAKAKFFISQGFSVARPDELAKAILDHTSTASLVKTENNGFIDKFVYEGDLAGPLYQIPRIRSIWKQENGKTFGELVAAHRF